APRARPPGAAGSAAPRYRRSRTGSSPGRPPRQRSTPRRPPSHARSSANTPPARPVPDGQEGPTPAAAAYSGPGPQRRQLAELGADRGGPPDQPADQRPGRPDHPYRWGRG